MATMEPIGAPTPGPRHPGNAPSPTVIPSATLPSGPTERLAAAEQLLAEVDRVEPAEQARLFEQIHSELAGALHASADRGPARGQS